jgi:hypothetical protein
MVPGVRRVRQREGALKRDHRGHLAEEIDGKDSRDPYGGEFLKKNYLYVGRVSGRKRERREQLGRRMVFSRIKKQTTTSAHTWL